MKGKRSAQDNDGYHGANSLWHHGASLETLENVVPDTSCPELVCFVALDPAAPAFFGFSEYLAGVACLTLAATQRMGRYLPVKIDFLRRTPRNGL